MSSVRLREYLLKAGRDEEEIVTWDRDQLMEEWAIEIAKGEEEEDELKIETDYDVQKRRLEFEMYKYEEEKKEREKERQERKEREEREERRRQEEREEREKERQERREKEEKERQERREKEERERQERKEKEEREERRRKEEQKEQKEKEERERKEKKEEQTIRASLASRTKRIGDALKNILWKFPSDLIEIPAFFDHLDNLFNLYEVDEDVRAKMLLANLNERAKALTMRLTEQQLNDYKFLKEFLLREFKISPSNLRERFWTMHNASDETFTIFSSKLRIALLYYLKSRQITNEFDKLVSLLCADRLKESLPKPYLDFVLAQEKGEWLGYKELAEAADIYVASHSGGSDTPHYSRPIPKYGNWSKGPTQVQVNDHAAQPKFVKQEVRTGVKVNPKMPKEEAKVKGLCFLCHQKGHMARECQSSKSSKKVDTCKVRMPTEEVCESVVDKITVSSEKCQLLDKEDSFDSSQLSEPEVDVRVYDNKVDGLQERFYVEVQIENLPIQSALSDSGAEICCIDKNLIEHLDLPVVKRLNVIGFQGAGCKVDVVYLQLRAANSAEGTTNIAPPLHVMFAIVPDLNERVILTPHVVNLFTVCSNGSRCRSISVS